MLRLSESLDHELDILDWELEKRPGQARRPDPSDLQARMSRTR